MPESIVYNTDCMDYMRGLADGYFDLAICDPPYGLDKSSTHGRGKLRDRILNTGHIQQWDVRPSQEYFDELRRVSKQQVIWGGNYFDLPPCRCFVVWDKQQPWENFSQAEFAWTSFDKPAKLVTIPKSGREQKIHPTQKPVKTFLREQRKDFDIVEYVGIAIDEPIRLKRLIGGGGKTHKMSLLEKYNYTEQMAYGLCVKFDLLSPIYDDSSRGGCWFCPNAKLSELVSFRKENPDLWREFLELSQTPNLCSDKFNRTGLTLIEIDKKLDQIEQSERRQLTLDF